MSETSLSAASDPTRRKFTSLDEIQTSDDIPIPSDPLGRVIGQEKAVELAGSRRTSTATSSSSAPPAWENR